MSDFFDKTSNKSAPSNSTLTRVLALALIKLGGVGKEVRLTPEEQDITGYGEQCQIDSSVDDETGDIVLRVDFSKE